MFRPLTRSHRRAPRRGTVVVITIFALITILMVLGLAFMMYAVKEKAVAQAYKEAASAPGTAAPDPTNTINRFLGTLIYDDYDDGDSLYNSLRGHSIARSMYGSRYDFSTTAWAGTTVPWNGVGTFHDAGAVDAALQVNHTLSLVNGAWYLRDPEWTNTRTITANSPVPQFATTRSGNYVAKNAGYTYPDLKDFFLGARDPATGEVLVSSFHREWLFGSLAPTNPNWINDTGRLKTLRPRPHANEHPNFPRVPPNADGTYTGDVQNLPGAVGVQRNDSLWMHIGLRPITLADRRIVQPMVAPLILPVDGLFDQAAHGNRLAEERTTPPPATDSSHMSYRGYAPWEINIGYGTVSEAERRGLLSNRLFSTNGQPARTSFDPYTSGSLFPTYSPVAWSSDPVAFTFPTGNSLTGVPTYTGFQSGNTVFPRHPAGHNPNELLPRSETNLLSPVFPYSDLKRLSLRYAFTPDWYNQAFTTRQAPGTFSGDQNTFQYISSPGATTQPATGKQAYRLDPAHTRRNLFSPRNNSLDRPAITPNFLSVDGSTALSLVVGTNNAWKPGALATDTSTYPGPQLRGKVSDFAGDNLWAGGIRTALESVNLNRPLADYRDLASLPNQPNNPQPLSSTNAANAVQAEADRQQLAKDIFARLCVTLGAAAQVDFDSTRGVLINLPQPGGSPGPYTLTIPGSPATTINVSAPQYNALRYLAQLAVNIVDYIDNDDVSTVFVWNPSDPTNPPSTLAADLSAAQIGNRAVFGVEKPRLVINEMYSEITNSKDDPVNGTAALLTADANVRFWAELVNPTVTPHTATTGIFGTGAVNLGAYQIQIGRAVRTTGVGAPEDLASELLDPTNANYQANVLGRFGSDPDATFKLPSTVSVIPNNGVYPPGANAPADGIVLVRPPTEAKAGSQEFNPPTTGVWTNAVISPALVAAKAATGGMGYTFTMPNSATPLSSTEFKRHVVLLRRLNNPYLPLNDPLTGTFDVNTPVNTYVTVDVMDYVPSFDAVHRYIGQMTGRPAYDAMNTTGYLPIASRFAVGKVQPLAGRSISSPPQDGNDKPNQYAFSNANDALNSMVLKQEPTTTDPNAPLNTFGRHNGKNAAPPPNSVVPGTPPMAGPPVVPGTPATLPSETIMTPFDWLPHMDRPLETVGDLFLVRDCKPYRLTNDFVVNVANSGGLVYDLDYARWRFQNDGLGRALEYLTVKSPDFRIPHGGRVGGKISVNAIQDRRVAQGLLDPQANNSFDLNFVNNTVWDKWVRSRTSIQGRVGADGIAANAFPVPIPNQLLDNMGVSNPVASRTDSMNGSDRPFLPFGAPVAAAGASGTTPFAYGAGIGTDDTILRRDTTSTVGLPSLYNPSPISANPIPAGPPLYLQSEPFRKVVNNVTTVSHSFVVYVTIGYFEIDTTQPALPAGPTGVSPQLRFGAEVFDKVPGDMRQKYMAFIDMSNMALKPQFPYTGDPDPSNAQAVEQPFFTALDTTVRPANPQLSFACTSYDSTNKILYVNADGRPMPIQGPTPTQAGTILVLGYGAEAQVVQVANNGISQNASTGSALVTVTGLTRTAWAGTCVSNVRPGYAGPQPSFDCTTPNPAPGTNAAKYKPVVPYIERLR